MHFTLHTIENYINIVNSLSKWQHWLKFSFTFFYSYKIIIKINAERNFEFNLKKKQTPIWAMHAIYSVGLGKRKNQYVLMIAKPSCMCFFLSLSRVRPQTWRRNVRSWWGQWRSWGGSSRRHPPPTQNSAASTSLMWSASMWNWLIEVKDW